MKVVAAADIIEDLVMAPPMVGHRQRLRSRFLSGQESALTEEGLLELLLTFAIPQKDVRPLAGTLLERFGSLQAVRNADPEVLRQVVGIGDTALVLIKLVSSIAGKSRLSSKTSQALESDHLQQALFPGDSVDSQIQKPRSVSSKSPRTSQRSQRSRTGLFGKGLMKETLEMLPQLPDTASMEEVRNFLRGALHFNSARTRQRYASYLTSRLFPTGRVDQALCAFAKQYPGTQALRDVCLYRFMQAEPLVVQFLQEGLLPALGRGFVTRSAVRHLDGVLRAHANLRTAQVGRFTDHDFKIIVAYASLGIADAAFKKLDSENLWRIGLLGHDALVELEALAPEIAGPIREALRKAPPPFSWFGEHDAEIVLRAFYLSVVLAQHLPNWRLLLANIDPSLAPFTGIDEKMLTQAAPDLIQLDENQAHRDLEAVEQSLSKDAIQFLMLDQLKIGEPAGFTSVLEKERYSIFVRSLSLLMALDNLLSSQPAEERHVRLEVLLFPETETPLSTLGFVDRRPSMTWSHLKEAYRLAFEMQQLRGELNSLVKDLTVRKTEQLTYTFFWEQWNNKKINRLEYYLSALERLIASGDFLPRAEAELPSAFANALDQVKQRLQTIGSEVQKQLDEVNSRFQEVVVAQYPTWLTTDSEVRLTSQFIRRCLKPHWDSQTEKAVIFIFDGMRYDIWDEMLRPMLVDRLEVVADLVASSLLPSETEISRWALAAGSAPISFWPKRAENVHFKESLQREFNYQGEVEVITPEGAGTGETVHYRAGNLEIYIFEFCDKELHKIQNKTLPDGRSVPGRPLAFVYQQHLKSLIDNEVMAIVRNLSAGTKVFITADHGFGRVHRERIGLEATWLNEPEDCSYLNAWLRQSLSSTKVPGKVRQNVWELSVDALGMPKAEESRDRRTKQVWQKQYTSVIFPKTGFALSRPGAHFNPDAYTHGGISMQELMIPMVVLRVKARDEGLLLMDQITGPRELGEGEEVEFRVQLNCAPGATLASDELRVDLEAIATTARPVAEETEAAMTLPRQVVYVPPQGCEVVFRYRFDPTNASNAERKAGTLERTLTVTASYREGRKMHRKSRTQRFTVRLNSEQIIRRVGNLGNILGLTPKSMR